MESIEAAEKDTVVNRDRNSVPSGTVLGKIAILSKSRGDKTTHPTLANHIHNHYNVNRFFRVGNLSRRLFRGS